MRGETYEGIVIKRTNFREADKIITLFTARHGKVQAIAKSLRKSSSLRTGSLELFNHVICHIVPGRGELPILTEVKLINGYHAWRPHLGRIALAYQICEAIDKLTPDHQPHPRIFRLLDSSLGHIGALGNGWQAQTDSWLLDLICTLGFWPTGQPFMGSITGFIEELASTSLHSPRLLARLQVDKVN
jgi:DNA repair protein RecO (recombination protein O)